MLPELLAGFGADQAQGQLVDLGQLQALLYQPVVLRIGVQPGLQLLAAGQAVFGQQIEQAGEVEHAQGDAAALEDVLVAPPGILQHAQRPVLLGDIAQHPGTARLAGVGIERVAGDVEQAPFTFQQCLDGFCLLMERIFHPRRQRRQQVQYVHLAGGGQVQAEHPLGAWVEVADMAVGPGHQYPLVDGAEYPDGIVQGAARQGVIGPQALLFAQQAVQDVQAQAGAGQRQQQPGDLQRHQFMVPARSVEQGRQLPQQQAEHQHHQHYQGALPHAAQGVVERIEKWAGNGRS